MFLRKSLIIFFLSQIISCGEALSPAEQKKSLYSPANMQIAPQDNLRADSPSVIQTKNKKDGPTSYYLFGSHGVWATSSDLRTWIEYTAQGDFNGNGVASEPNDNVLGFRVFKTRDEAAPANFNGSSGYYYQLSREKGRGILWANDANADGIVGTTPIQENSDIKEIETVGLWSPSVVQLADGNYYFYYSHCNLPGTSYCSDSHAYMGVARAPTIEGPYENISIFMQSGEQVGAGQSDQIPGYDGSGWAPQHHPSALAPDVFLDKEEQPWLVYGSNAGGIWVKQLDAQTGLPLDLDKEQRSYGTRIAGGYLSAIDSPSIWYNPEAGYYYLLLTYMGSDTRDRVAFNIRVARAKDPEGPYIDAAGKNLSEMYVEEKTTTDAFILDETETATYGVKLLGNHLWQSELGDATEQAGYWSPGNASIFADRVTGKTFLVFDTATSAAPEPRYVRLHEIHFNRYGWPVVAPHPYMPTKSEQAVKLKDVVGDYQLIYHASDNNVAPHESIFAHLASDGSISGDVTGSFEVDGNHLALELDNLGSFSAVATWQINDRLDQSQLVPTFSAVATNGLASLWATQLPTQSIEDKFDSIKSALAALVPSKMTEAPDLPTRAARGASVIWHSPDSQLIDLTSKVVTRPAPGMGDAHTRLQATITLPDNSNTIVEFPVSVPAQSANNLIAHYRFEGKLEESISGRNPGATTGKHLHLPNPGGAKFVDGQQGKALLLDGTYGVNLGVGLLPYNSFTLSYWMKPTAIEPNQPSLFIIPRESKSTYDGGTFFGIYNQVNDWGRAITVWNRNGSDEDWPFLAGLYAAKLDTWQHVALSCKHGDCTLYVNGQSSGNTKLGSVIGEDVTLAIGVNLWDKSFVGLIDELKIYDEALSATEINALDYINTPKSQWLDIAAQDLKQKLQAQEIDTLRENLHLSEQGLFQSTISWSSSNVDIITSAGQISRPKPGESSNNTTLTATLSLGGEQQTLSFPIKVIPEYIPEPLISYSFEDDLYDNQWNHSSDKLMGRHLMAEADVAATARYKPGIQGKALYLDGTYGAILAEHLIMDDDYTISIWLKPDALTLHTTALFWYVNWDEWLSLAPYDINESINVWTLKQGTYTDHRYDTPLRIGEWVHLILSVEGNKVVGYMNGDRITAFETMPNLFAGHPTNLAVGINFWDKPYQGLIDELVVYPASIGDAEASRLYSQYQFLK